MSAALAAAGLGKRYGSTWALRDCSLEIPAGKVVGLVGPNGAGKTTMLQLATGLLKPTAGSITIFGDRPGANPAQLARVGFVAQQTPTYADLSVADHLRLGAWLNPEWNRQFAEEQVASLGLDPRKKTGNLSGGQRAQLALTLAVAKRPELLILDEPVASLDPLARRDFLGFVMAVVAAWGVTVILSSHLVADVERVSDYLVILSASQVQVAGDIDELIAAHVRLTGPRLAVATLPKAYDVVQASHTARQSSLIVRTTAKYHDPAWTVEPVGLEDLVLAYMALGARGTGPLPTLAEVRS